MKKGISLIQVEKGPSDIAKKIKKLLIYSSLFFLLITIIVSVGTLYFYISTNNNLLENTNKLADLKTEIKKLETEEIYLVTVANRIDSIEKINKIRFLPSKIINETTALIVPGFSFSTFELSTNKVRIEGRCENLASLASLNEKVDQVKTEKVFSDYSLSDINRAQNGDYSVVLTLYK